MNTRFVSILITITICQYKVGFFWNRSFPLDAVLSWGHRSLVMGPILAHVWGSCVQVQESCPKVWDLGSCPIVRGLRSFPRVHGLGFYHRVWSLGSGVLLNGPGSKVRPKGLGLGFCKRFNCLGCKVLLEGLGFYFSCMPWYFDRNHR